MGLGLDLSSSRAKLARAVQHIEILERELPADVSTAGSGPYSIRFSQVDPQTGWCDVLIAPNKTKKPRFSVIVGDVVHNLRCALDYIVTALVEASNATVTTRHQFPIYQDAPRYLKKVGDPANAPATKGPLCDVVHGAVLIRDWQPYRLKPDPRADPLWHIYRFSNADKHREPAAFLALPAGKIDIGWKGKMVESVPVLEIPNWSPDHEHVIHRFRFDPPRAYNFHIKSPLSVSILFVTPAFDREPSHSIGVSILRKCCDHVAMVLDAFELL